MNINETMIDTVDKMVALEVQNNPQLTPYQGVMKQFFNKHMTGPLMIEEFAQLYMGEFSEDELNDITRFYQTPTGMKAIEKLPILAQKGAIWGQSKVQQNLPELQQMIKAEAERLNAMSQSAP